MKNVLTCLGMGSATVSVAASRVSREALLPSTLNSPNSQRTPIKPRLSRIKANQGKLSLFAKLKNSQFALKFYEIIGKSAKKCPKNTSKNHAKLVEKTANFLHQSTVKKMVAVRKDRCHRQPLTAPLLPAFPPKPIGSNRRRPNSPAESSRAIQCGPLPGD
jgi:hypothetical protein